MSERPAPSPTPTPELGAYNPKKLKREPGGLVWVGGNLAVDGERVDDVIQWTVTAQRKGDRSWRVGSFQTKSTPNSGVIRRIVLDLLDRHPRFKAVGS